MYSSGAGRATPALLTRPCSGPAATTERAGGAHRVVVEQVDEQGSDRVAVLCGERVGIRLLANRGEDVEARSTSSATVARPMPVEAPVTTTEGRLEDELIVGDTGLEPMTSSV